MTMRGERERQRVLILAVRPEVDGGRYPAKTIAGDRTEVSCDLLADGHDAVAGALLFRRTDGAGEWKRVPLTAGANDRWSASFVPDGVGLYEFDVEAWIDSFSTWREGTRKKLAAAQDVHNELALGELLLRATAKRTSGDERAMLEEAAAAVTNKTSSPEARFQAVSSDALALLARRYPDRTRVTRLPAPLRLVVDPPRARFSSWYELFPRSTGAPGKHGTLRDTVARLPYVAAMGFDVLYLPPIHPIGRAFRKGPNNTLDATPDDVGSPWAIGAREGGHLAVHPELGTLDDLRLLVREARAVGIDVALDIAFQASPDHPYVKAHPAWFVHRADGSIQYAENPPKKYEDVYPFDFESEDATGLWQELLGVFLFWAEQGVRIFRVDNPHTKSLRFWEWCLTEVKAKYPEALFWRKRSRGRS